MFTLLRRGFTILRRDSHFWKTGFTFIKIILSSCYWGVYTFEKGVNFLERGVHAFEKKNKEFTFMKILNNIGEGGFTLLRSGFTFSKKGVFKFIKT